MLLELGRAVSFFLCILSIYWVMLSSFFVPGSRWQERLDMCAIRVALAGCVCLASGLLFTRPLQSSAKARTPLTSTLPIRMYLWSLAGMTAIFIFSWYIEDYYLPWARKG